MKSAIKIIPGLLLAMTVGCSIKYQCELGQECYNTEDAYNAAVAKEGNSETVMPYGPVKSESLSDGKKKDKRRRTSSKAETGAWQPYSGSRLTDRPVYQPPQPRRIWVAPWKEGGILRAGQFIFVTESGHWNYGELKKAGQASQVLSPIKPKSDVPKRVQPKENLMPRAKKRK